MKCERQRHISMSSRPRADFFVESRPGLGIGKKVWQAMQAGDEIGVLDEEIPFDEGGSQGEKDVPEVVRRVDGSRRPDAFDRVLQEVPFVIGLEWRVERIESMFWKFEYPLCALGEGVEE